MNRFLSNCAAVSRLSPFPFRVLVYFFICGNNASLEIVAGYWHNCVYEPGQTGMMCWGDNRFGQLGYEDTNNRGDDAGEMSANLPIVNLGPTFIVNTASLGGYLSCAASQEHAVKCWGRGQYYQTGHATTNTLGNAAGEMGVNLAFVEFRVDFVPLKVAAGSAHSCVLSTDALVVCFGYNEFGQCGTGTISTYIIGPPSNIADVDLGWNFTPIDISAFNVHVCAISQQQTIKCFGDNNVGQLGYGDTTTRGLTPQSMGDGLLVVSLGSNFTPKAVAVGGRHTCALSTLKTVKCFGDNTFGDNTYGYNYIGDEANEMADNLPVIVFPDGFVPMQMALGYYHTCILSESGQVACFGRNQYGQLGLGHTTTTTSPTLVDLGTDFIARKITAGAYHTCAVSSVDTVKCWGKNDYGQLGLGHANHMGDAPNEMGDNLQIVDVLLTAAPTTGQCNVFSLRITSSLSAAPQLMYRNLQMLSLILNSTKLAIFDEIRVASFVYNVSQFAVGGDLWTAFMVYFVAGDEFENGVDFSMEYCSSSANFTEYISYKMARDLLYDNEIGHHAQWLLRTSHPLSIADAVVTITAVEGAQLPDDLASSSSYQRAFEVLLACFIAFVVFVFIGAFAFMLWRRKQRVIRHDDHAARREEPAMEMHIRSPMEQQKEDAQAVNNTNQHHGELHLDNEGAGQDQNADNDIISAINQTVLE